jgi:hypothetical protein
MQVLIWDVFVKGSVDCEMLDVKVVDISEATINVKQVFLNNHNVVTEFP